MRASSFPYCLLSFLSTKMDAEGIRRGQPKPKYQQA
jgi:hypothetical protein